MKLNNKWNLHYTYLKHAYIINYTQRNQFGFNLETYLWPTFPVAYHIKTKANNRKIYYFRQVTPHMTGIHS